MAATASYQPVWSDVEKGSVQDDFAYAFAEKTVRLGFIRKVFGKCFATIIYVWMHFHDRMLVLLFCRTLGMHTLSASMHVAL